MSKMIKKLLDRYFWLPANSAISNCPDCGNDLQHDSKVCKECGSERKSVTIQMNEPLYIGKRPPRKIRKTFFYCLIHILLYGLLLYVLIDQTPRLISRVDTLDWFFSTVTQAYIALIALLVAVITFRLQSNNNERTDLGRRIHEQSVFFLNVEADGMTIDDAISFAKSITNKGYTDKARVNRIVNLAKRIKHIETSNLTIKSSLKVTFWASVTASLLSLVFLILVDYLYLFHLETIAVVIVLEAVCLATAFTWKLVKTLR